MINLMNGHRKEPDDLKGKKFSCSAFMLYLGLDKIYEDEPHHHILFADDYARNVKDIQSESKVSTDMSIYVRNSSVTDPTVAPEGRRHSKRSLYVVSEVASKRPKNDAQGSLSQDGDC